MKLHSPQFKENIKTLGRELDAKIIYGEEELTTEELNRVSIRFNSEFFRTIMKEVEFETAIKITANQWINVQAGIKVDGEYEYIDYGNYYINKEPEYNADTESYTYIAYDKMIESMVSYDDNPLDIEYPISYKNYIIEICNKLNWDYNLPVSFPNMNTEINEDIYIDLGLTYRDLLDDICPCSMGNFVNDGEFKIIYPNETGDTIDDEFLKVDNVVIGNKIGPINSIVLSRAEDGDTINRQDTDSIAINGVKEIKIKDNILLSTTYRESFIDEMFNKIKGFEYYAIDVATTGIMYYESLDKFTINHDSINYPTIILNSELNIDDGIEELLYSPELEESVTNYETSSQTDKAKKMATIVAYKNQAKITLLVSSIEEVETELQDNVANLQAQIDGQIQFWNGSEIPSLANEPASEWITEALKNNHRADIYTVIEDIQGELKQGKSYRFDKVNNVWTWVELTDNELSAVQALAASKAKVFISQPTANDEYNIGDLWLNCSVSPHSNEMVRCKTAKAKGVAFNIAHWDKASKYTDDTRADAAQTTANTAAANANTANAKLADIASDSKLTPDEKQSTKKEWDIIVSEQPDLADNAEQFGVSSVYYVNKYNALNTYITPLLANLTITSDIVGATFRGKFKEYYDARTALVIAINTAQKEVTDTLTNATTLTATTEEAKTFHLTDSTDGSIKEAELYGESTQGANPAPNNPQEISSVTSPAIINIIGKNTLNINDFIEVAGSTLSVSETTFDNADCVKISRRSATSYTYALNCKANTQHTISMKLGSSYNDYYIYFVYGDNTTSIIKASTQLSTLTNIQATSTANKTIIGIKFELYGWSNNLYIDKNSMLLEVGTTATPYEPYKEQIISIPLLHSMKSLFNGIRDRIYYDNGKWYFEQKINNVLIDTTKGIWEGYNTRTTTTRFYIRKLLNDMIQTQNNINIYSNYFEHKLIYNLDEPGVYLNYANYNYNSLYISIPNSIGTTDTEIKNWFNNHNVYIQYELATPMTTEITDTETITALEGIKTYKGITNITSDILAKLTYYRDTDFNSEYETIVEAQKKQKSTIERFAEVDITNTNIRNTVSQIETEIAENYVTKNEVSTQINQTVDEITATVQKVGGNNLIKNSAMKNGSNFWFAHLLAPYIESDTPPTEELYDGAYWYCSSNYEDYQLGIIYRYESGNWIETTFTRKLIDDSQNLLKYTTQYENDYTRQNTLSNSMIKLDGGTNLDISHIFNCANPIDIIKGQDYITLSFKLKNSMKTGVGYVALGFTEKYIDNALAELVYSLYEPCVWFTPDDVKDLTEIVLTVKVPQKGDFIEATAGLTAPTTDKIWIDLNTYQLKEYNEETETWERKQTILPCYETTTRQIWAYRQLFDIYYETPVNFDNFEIKCVYPAFTMYPEFMRLIPSDIAPTPFKGAYWLNVVENVYRAKYDGDEFVEWEDTGISTEYIMTHPVPTPPWPTPYAVPLQGYYEVADIKAEWNKVATDWNGYIGEIYGKNVKIDEKGMKILSGQNTMFIDEDEIIAKFNDQSVFIISKDLVQFNKLLLIQQMQMGSYIFESRNINSEEHLLLY